MTTLVQNVDAGLFVGNSLISSQEGPQGPQGERGTDGASASITDVTATIDSNVGTPAVTVTMGGGKQMDTGIFIGDKIITTSWDKIWNKPNTLSGYGITDAYTQSDADGRFFRYFGYTTDDGDDFMWQKLGTFTYLNAFPDGVTIKRHGYGQVTSFIAGSSRFQLYSTHSSSDPNDGPNGIQFRSGWDDDKKSWRMLLDEVNYLHYTDNRYVNKAGDTMTGKLLFNADSGIDLTSIPRTKSAISFNNAGSNRIGINFTDGDGNLRIARTDINQDWVSGDVNILLGSNNYKVWHAGNDGSGSGLDADLLDNKHLGNVGDRVMRQIGFPNYNEFGSNDTNVYLRKILGWCYNNVNTGADDSLFIGVGHPNALGNMQIQVYCNSGINEEGYPRYSSGVFFPLGSAPYLFGTNDYNYYQYALATTDGNVYSATKLQTPRYIFSKPFDGTGNITGGAKFSNICIETDNNGNDSGRSSEINNYVGPLQLQQASPNGIHMCMGGGQVGICTTSPKYTLHVDGVIYAKDGFRETSDIRKKKVLNSHTVDLDVMAYADLFDYTLIDDEKEIVRIGTNAHYWLDKLPQVVTKDNDEYLSLNYGVLGTVCALSVSKYVKQLEDRVTLLENKIASLQ